LRLEWTANAKQDLREIITHIGADDVSAARRMNGRFRTVARLLAHSPFSGKPGILPGTREFVVHPSYRLLYRIKGETVSVVALVHTAREWPPAEDGI
jgi:plasmid stabilization system protein ParE